MKRNIKTNVTRCVKCGKPIKGKADWDEIGPYHPKCFPDVIKDC